MKRIFRYCVIFFTLWCTIAESAELYFVDAHSQIDHEVDLNKIIELMDQGGVRNTILSARGNLKDKELIAFSKANKSRIILAVRTKGKAYSEGDSEYYTHLDKQIASGNFGAMAEILLYHAQKGTKAPEVTIFPNDKRVQTALKYAVRKGWPFVIHIEFSSLHGKNREGFMKSLKVLLSENPQHPFVLTHMGQLSAGEVRKLIESYPNIYFHTGWTNPIAVRSSGQPWTNLFSGNTFTSEWRELMIQYPDRFIFALDNVFAEHWTSFYLEQIDYWRKALSDLPDDTAHMIAHGNAERLWKVETRKER